MITSTRLARVVFAIGLAVWPLLGKAEEFRYRYIDLNVPIPGYDFFAPSAMNDSGAIAGTVFSCNDVSCFDDHVAIYRHGTVSVLQPGDGGPINAGGTIGGFIVLDPDPDNFQLQAALFRGQNRTLIPRQPDDIQTFVIALNDGNVAMVDAFDTTHERLDLYRHGQTAPINFGDKITSPAFFQTKVLNNNSIIAGTNFLGFRGDHAFRFNANTGMGQLLDPVLPDTLSWGLGINNRDYVLGYSFVLGAPYHERVGLWDRTGRFTTYYYEEINTSGLVFNDKNEIIITNLEHQNGTSYLVPRAGVRLSLVDLVENLPAGAGLDFVQTINNRGDILGSGATGNIFLLKHICSESDESEADTEAALAVAPPAISAAAMETLKLRPEMQFARPGPVIAKHL